jgi:hypothetical protein
MDCKVDRRSVFLSNPVSLHGYNSLGPERRVEVRKEPLFEVSKGDEPLLQQTTLDLCAGSPRVAVCVDLFVGQDGAVNGIPIDVVLCLVCRAGFE